MLRFRADIRTLVFIAAYFAMVTWQWLAAPSALYLATPLVVATCALSWIAAIITHNTLHSPIFKSRFLNRAFQVVLTVTYGFPVSEYVPGHNLSHHRFTQTRRDVMRTTKVNWGWNLLNFAAFVPRVAGNVFVANIKYIKTMREKKPVWFRQLIIETVVCWGSKAVLLAIDWRKAMLYIVLPHAFALWGITAVNYVQHDGCDRDSEFNHSRNFVGRIFNWFVFNNGFHAMHHKEPGLHWSLLAAAHSEQFHGRIDRRLEEPSLFLYLLKTFVWPGRRVRFDGEPVVITNEGPDEEWIPSSGGTASDLGAVGEGA